MDSNHDRCPLAAADDDDRIHAANTLPRSTAASSSDDHRLLGYAFSQFLILNSPELPPYWSEGPKANWLHLPREVLATILLKLGAIEIIESAQKVCSLWRSVCMDPSLWTRIDMKNSGDRNYMRYDLAKMCRHAIDRSCGGCVDINIENFGDDDLLNYIIESGCKLRRLRLEYCLSVSDKGMTEAAPRLSFLETFQFLKGNLAENALKAIGKNCPRLTTLLYEQEYICPPWGMDNEAFTIAKHMPGLRCLSLLGIKLTNKVLGAILDGCPHLESLDLRQCLNVDLKGDDLAKKCERIKDLKLPRVSIASNDDYKDYYSDSDYISGFDYEDFERPWVSTASNDDYEDYYSDSDFKFGYEYFGL